jgi:hypothetical protein
MSRPVNHGGVVVLLSGPTEQLVIEIFALLSQTFPHRHGPAFERALSLLRTRMAPESAVGIVNGFMSLMATMSAAGRLPRPRSRLKTAGKDELFLIAMLGAAQRGNNGRVIEAAIALLDSGHVYGVVAAARSLALRLGESGVILKPIGETTFDYVAGYPRVVSIGAPATLPAPPNGTGKPTLRVLKSA